MAQPDPLRRPFVLAHRGGGGVAPENTLVAFEAGLALGADGIELDVHLSRDGEPVVIHDTTLDRTTDGHGEVASHAADELGRFDAGYRFARDGTFPFRGLSHGVPRLRDVLARYPVETLIELKTPAAALVDAVLDVVRQAGAEHRVLMGSFHRDALDAVRERAPSVRRGATREEILAVSRAGSAEDVPRFDCDSFQVPETFGGERVLTPAFVQRAHHLGRRVIVWTVDTAEDIERLLGWGVDGIITDRPDVAAPAVRAWWQRRERE